MREIDPKKFKKWYPRMVQVTISLSPDLLDHLDRIARESGRSRSSLIREIIRREMNEMIEHE